MSLEQALARPEAFRGFDITLDGDVARIVIATPERRNAISNAMLDSLDRLADVVSDDPDVRAVIIRGAGDKAFSAGFDLRELSEFSADHFIENRFAAVMEKWGALAKPVIGAMNGFCHGGGVQLAMACDALVAVPDVVFAIPAARLGFAYPLRGIDRIRNVLGPARAATLLYLDGRLSIRDVAETGLVHAIVPLEQLDEKAGEIAQRCAALAPLAVAGMKTLVHRSPSRDEQFRLYSAIAASADLQEGMAALKEKRSPRYRGH